MKTCAVGLVLLIAGCLEQRPPPAELILGEGTCDPRIGLTAPLPACSPDEPCRRLLPLYERAGIAEIAEPSTLPRCATTEEGRRMFDDGAPHTMVDDGGVTRSWCEFRPPGTSAASPRPLVLFAIGSGGSASDAYDYLSLRGKAEAFELGNGRGFILVSLQPRNLHWPTTNPEDGSKFDTYYRDLASPSTNPDIAFADAVVDGLVAEGVVDRARIYTMGWSNGGRFASLYAIARHDAETPSGNRVAAFANYTSGDPFENITATQEPSCKLAEYPTTTVPAMIMSRSCDIVACNEQHAQAFTDGGHPMTPGNVAATWTTTLGAMGADVRWLRISDDGTDADGCALRCGFLRALTNHVRWPDGIADRRGNDREPDLLRFLRDHPLVP
jgi:pimeloyl-ACP methyl ester carboxylesterase